MPHRKNRIKALRKERGLTQTDLAEKVGTTQQNIARWEDNSNSRELKATTAVEIAGVLGVPVSYLMGFGDDSMIAPRPAGEDELVRLYQDMSVEGRRMLLDIARSLAVTHSSGDGQSIAVSSEVA